jgi:uncharacterized membrane-anchored protein
MLVYVKDDDKSSLDADAMMKSIRQGTEEANAERKSRGWKRWRLSAGCGCLIMT